MSENDAHRPLRVWPCAADAWRTLGLSGSQCSTVESIRRVCRGARASTRGFGWRFAAAPRGGDSGSDREDRASQKKPVLVVQLDLAGTTVTP